MTDQTLPAGFVPWHGGDTAPSDWDGGPVLLRCGRTLNGKPERWTHRKRTSSYDIIAYRPKPQPALTAPDREAVARALATAERYHGLGSEPVARFVQPSAADVLLAERIVNSPQVISAYAACEFDELDENGRLWIAAIVRAALAVQPVDGAVEAQQAPPSTVDLHIEEDGA